jgi:hypothetical protein
MKHVSEIYPDIRILKQSIDQAASDLEHYESGQGADLGSLIYLGSHLDLGSPRNPRHGSPLRMKRSFEKASMRPRSDPCG